MDSQKLIFGYCFICEGENENGRWHGSGVLIQEELSESNIDSFDILL